MKALILVAALAAAPAAAADHGAAIYDRACAVCHGYDGTGAMPGVADLTDPAGALAKSDAELMRSLRDGVEGDAAAMPPRGGDDSLTDGDLAAVLAHIRAAFGGSQGDKP
ncbi:MAG: cytochrome c [Rhodospirillales bacterium]|nr:cytochrome c [Rhodospirillales bacterium]